MDPICKLEQLSCKAGNKYILKDIDWEVQKGQHWVVFGMNGSGKTTLLSIIAGYMAHTHGDLEVFGQHYNDDNILELRQRIGWVSASFFDKCLSHETVLDIVLAGKFSTLGLDDAITDSDVVRAKALLTELRLKSKIAYPFDFLSKGERQNVLIARALMTNPELLILDEPCTGLDVFSREYLLSTLRDLAQNTDVTIIFVTHYTEEILDIFPNCLLLKNGRIYAKDRTDQIFTSERLSEFLNYPVTVSWQNNRIQVRLEVDSHMKALLQNNPSADSSSEYKQLCIQSDSNY